MRGSDENKKKSNPEERNKFDKQKNIPLINLCRFIKSLIAFRNIFNPTQFFFIFERNKN